MNAVINLLRIIQTIGSMPKKKFCMQFDVSTTRLHLTNFIVLFTIDSKQGNAATTTIDQTIKQYCSWKIVIIYSPMGVVFVTVICRWQNLPYECWDTLNVGLFGGKWRCYGSFCFWQGDSSVSCLQCSAIIGSIPTHTHKVPEWIKMNKENESNEHIKIR